MVVCLQKQGTSHWDRIESGTKSGLGFGAAVGALRGAWDVRTSPEIRLLLLVVCKLDRFSADTHSHADAQFNMSPAVSGEGGVVMSKAVTTLGSTMLMFGGIAFVYTAVEASMEGLRGTADWRNGAAGGLAAGAIHS